MGVLGRAMKMKHGLDLPEAEGDAANKKAKNDDANSDKDAVAASKASQEDKSAGQVGPAASAPAAPEPATAPSAEPPADGAAPPEVDRKAPRDCSECHQTLAKDKFSNGQWKKFFTKNPQTAKCKECIDRLVKAPLIAKHQGWSAGATKRPDQAQNQPKSAGAGSTTGI